MFLGGAKIRLFSRSQACFLFFPKIRSRLLSIIDGHRRHHPDAHVGPDVVVYMYHSGDGGFGLFPVPEDLLMVDPFDLQDAVDAFCDGVVRGVVPFRHADPDMVFDEFVDILVAGILHSLVGVVYRAAEVAAPCRTYGHRQRLHGVVGLQRVGQAPAYHRMGVCVGDQVQIQNVPLYPYVCDVGRPYMVDVQCGDARNQVGVLPVHVVGIRRMDPFGTFQFESHRRVRLEEGVPPPGDLLTDILPHQRVEFRPAYPGHQPPVIADMLFYQLRPLCLRHDHCGLLVVPLAFPAKQSAQYLHADLGVFFAQRRHCLAPSFFNMLMPSSASAISISFSYARLRIRS